jgi:negative regulator of flagellin synthesis FlgM
MKIQRTNIKGVSDFYRVGTARPGINQAQGQNPAAVSQVDTLDVSQKAQQATALREMLRQVPEIRAELLQRIKAQLDAGTYHVDTEALVERLMKAKVLDA